MAKKKERVLTPEEVKARIKKEKSDFWIHSEPQFSLMPTQHGLKFFPLNDAVEKQITILFLLDVGEFCTERAFDLIEHWKKRYAHLNWKAIVAFQQKYTFINHSKFFERFKSFNCFSTLPVHIDTFGELFDWVNADNKPTIALINQGNVIFKEALTPDFGKQVINTEAHLQEALRIEDPGLPLPVLYQYQVKGPIDKQTFLPKDLTLKGQWLEGKGSMMTDDIRASVSFPFKGRNLRFISSLHPQAREYTKVIVKFNQENLNEKIMGKSLRFDEKKNTLFEVNTSIGIYDVLKSEEEMQGTVELFFINAFESPIIVHEVKIA